MILFIDGTKNNVLSLFLIEESKNVVQESKEIPFEEGENLAGSIDRANTFFIEYCEAHHIQFDEKGIGLDRVFVNTGPGSKYGILYSIELAHLLLFVYDIEVLLVENKNLPKNLTNILFGSKNPDKMFKDGKNTKMFIFLAESMGFMLHAKEFHKTAIILCEKLRHLVRKVEKSTFSDIYNLLAVSCMRIDDYALALKYLEEVKDDEFAQDDGSLWYNLAVSYSRTGDMNKAKASLETALKIDKEKFTSLVKSDEILNELL